MMDRSDAIVVRWRYADDRSGAWLREDHVRVGAGEWRRVGRERVDSIGFEGPIPGESIDGVGEVRTGP
jgi:hypothetical protein